MHLKLVIASALLAFQAVIAPEDAGPGTKHGLPSAPHAAAKAAPSATPDPAAPTALPTDAPRATAPLDPVTIDEILPLRMVYEGNGSGASDEIVHVSEKQICKQRLTGDQWTTISTMPLDRNALARVLAGVRKEDFRGIVRYTNRYSRENNPRRMITPLGEIEEYGIIDAEEDAAFPKAIVRLKPLYQLLDCWREGTDPLGNALQSAPGLRQPLPENEIAEALVRLDAGQPIDATILCRALVSSHTTLRARAAQRLGEMNDRSVVQDLILALKDPSQHEGASYPKPGMNTTRWWANESLKKLTGHDTGYRWDAPPAERDHAIQKWVVWMKGNAGI